jgi:hypothetical protein
MHTNEAGIRVHEKVMPFMRVIDLSANSNASMFADFSLFDMTLKISFSISLIYTIFFDGEESQELGVL